MEIRIGRWTMGHYFRRLFPVKEEETVLDEEIIIEDNEEVVEETTDEHPEEQPSQETAPVEDQLLGTNEDPELTQDEGVPLDIDQPVIKDNPPEITTMWVTEVDETRADIGFKTVELSIGAIRFGTGELQETIVDSTLSTVHEFRVTDLAVGKTYYFKFMATNQSGDEISSEEMEFVQ